MKQSSLAITSPAVLTQLKKLLVPPVDSLKLGKFLEKAKPHSLGPDAMEIMIVGDAISTATLHKDRFTGIDASLTRKLLKSRQLLGDFSSHSFVDLPKTLIKSIVDLQSGLSVTKINLANFIAKDQEAVLEYVLAACKDSEFKNSVLLNTALQLATVHGLTNKMLERITKYLPTSHGKYLKPVLENLDSYPFLDKNKVKKDLEKKGFTALTKKFAKQLYL